MNNNNNKDDDGDSDFHRFFPGFGGFGFGDMFRDMNQQMEEMSRLMDEFFNTSRDIGFPPPTDIGGDTTGHSLKDDPRDSMLKNDEGHKNDFNKVFHPPQSGKPQSLRDDPRDSMLKTDDSGSTPSGQFQTSFRNPTASIWGNRDGNVSFFPASDSYITGRMRSVQTIRRGDGSVERVEKTTENGRTCTTITKTDPAGNSTTTTTCDKPAIDAGPGLIKSDTPSMDVHTPTIPTLNTEQNVPSLSEFYARKFNQFLQKFGFKKPDS